ncbi:MAG: GT4 family glycosyltransferase PelF, partial [Elusimicrobiota bacterium]
MTDVCLILEGTYPFVSGGVSTWIHQLVSAMSELRFSILYISPFPNPRREYKYKVPSNVVEIQDLYLHEHSFAKGRSWPWRRRRVFKTIMDIQKRIGEEDWGALAEALPYLREKGVALTDWDFFDSQEAWEALAAVYSSSGGHVSFLDYFWTWRSMHLSLFKTLRAPIPKARLYHTVSTGYAGVLASVAKATQDRAMLLTEHGVYTHERLLEISQAT